MGGVPNALGPSSTLGSLGTSHQWHHKSRASLRGLACAHSVAGTSQGEVLNTTSPTLSSQASACFIISVIIKSNKYSIRVSVLFDSGALACFIDKDFAECYK